MMPEIVCLLMSIVLFCAATIVRPPRAHAPAGFWVNGTRGDGYFELRRVPIGDDTIKPGGGEIDLSVQPPGVIVSRIFCADGKRSIVVDERTVGCTP